MGIKLQLRDNLNRHLHIRLIQHVYWYNTLFSNLVHQYITSNSPWHQRKTHFCTHINQHAWSKTVLELKRTHSMKPLSLYSLTGAVSASQTETWLSLEKRYSCPIPDRTNTCLVTLSSYIRFFKMPLFAFIFFDQKRVFYLLIEIPHLLFQGYRLMNWDKNHHKAIQSITTSNPPSSENACNFFRLNSQALKFFLLFSPLLSLFSLVFTKLIFILACLFVLWESQNAHLERQSNSSRQAHTLKSKWIVT